MHRKFSKSLLISFALIISFAARSYDIDQLKGYQEKYPNDIGVVLNHDQRVEIDIDKKTGELIILETDYEEILYLKQAAKFYTSDGITTSDFFEDILSIEVTVYNADGKKFKLDKTDFKLVDAPPSSWVFHDDDKELVFDLQELGEGYRTIIEYTKQIKRPEFFDSFHFMSVYPVEKSSVSIIHPNNVQLKYYEMNLNGYSVERNEVALKKDRVLEKWQIENLAAFQAEAGSTDMKYHIPHFIAQIQSYSWNNEEKRLIGSPAELHNYFQEFLLLSEQIYNVGDEHQDKANEPLYELVDSLIIGKSTDLERMDTIFRWVQSNIKYIAFEDGINGYVPRSCNKVLRNRYGDCKDMTNLLVAMLNYADVPGARVAWVGTREIPYLMSEIPTPLACNHVICVVEKGGGEYYFLDATGSEGSYLLPPSGIQGKELLIHNKTDDFVLYKVPLVDATDNYLKSVIFFKLDEDDSLRGVGTDYYGGYEREDKSYRLKNLNKDDLDEYVKNVTLGGFNRFSLNDYKIENLNRNQEELTIKYDFSVDNLFIRLDSTLILNPTIFKPNISKYNLTRHKYTRFKDHQRTVDYTFEFEIPAGYEIVHLPKGSQFSHQDFGYISSFNLKGNKLVVNHKYHYNLIEIPVDFYGEWNKMADEINSSTIQNIILQKKSL